MDTVRTRAVIFRVLPWFMWLALAVPIAGWLVAQGMTDRILVNSAFTNAMVDSLAASTFAVILAMSMIANATIVTVRHRDHPASYRRLTRLPLWLLILLGLGTIWVISVARAHGANSWVEPVVALLVAAVSIVVFVFALKRDAVSTAAKRARREALAEAFSPEQKRRRRRISIAAGVTVAAAFAIGFILLQTVTRQVEHCEVIGKGQTGASTSLYSTNCGDFDLADGVASYSSIELAVYYDLVTRGYAFGIPPRPIIVEMTRSGE